MRVILLSGILLYSIVFYFPVLHCSKLPPGINPFKVNNNNNHNNNNLVIQNYLVKLLNIRPLAKYY